MVSYLVGRECEVCGVQATYAVVDFEQVREPKHPGDRFCGCFEPVGRLRYYCAEHMRAPKVDRFAERRR